MNGAASARCAMREESAHATRPVYRYTPGTKLLLLAQFAALDPLEFRVARVPIVSFRFVSFRGASSASERSILDR